MATQRNDQHTLLQNQTKQDGYQGIFSGNGPKVTMRSHYSVHAVQPVYYLRDKSGSMSGEKENQADQGFAESMAILADGENRDGFVVTAVAFNEAPQELGRFKSPKDMLAVQPNRASGGTNLGLAIEMTNRIAAQWTPGVHQQSLPGVYVILSDGCTSDEALTRSEAQAAKANGATIITIGYGDDADEVLLKDIATSPQHYRKLMTGSELRQFFAKVGHTLRQTQRAGTNAAAALATI